MRLIDADKIDAYIGLEYDGKGEVDLDDIPTVNTSNDCISRDTVIGIIKELPNANPSYNHTCDVIDRADLLYILERLESVYPQRKQGTWIEVGTYDEWGPYVKCSVCGEANGHDQPNFCPRCGADLRYEKGEHE